MGVERITVAPSVAIAVALGGAHLAAGVLVWLAPLPLGAQVALTLGAAASLVYFTARDAALHAAHSVVGLELREDGTAACHTRGGDWLDCEVLGSSYVSPRLTVIRLRPRGWRLTLRAVLVPDNIDPRDFRRLRTWLRWKGAGRAERAYFSG